jgi:predicted metal-dependent hydrolase
MTRRAAGKTMTVRGLAVNVVPSTGRRLRLVVSRQDGSVRLSLPRSTSLADGRQFVVAQWDWLQASRTRAVAAASRRTGPIEPGRSVDLWGGDAVAEFTGEGGAPRARVDQGVILFAGLTPGPEHAQEQHAALNAFYKDQVLRAIEPMIGVWSPIVGHRPARRTVRAMTSRWGSCSSHTGRVTFNLSLARFHPQFLTEVVVHELVHLGVPNHGPDFRAAMGRALPQWRQIARTLRTYTP